MFKKLTCALLVAVLLVGFLPTTAFARDELKNTDPEKYYIVLDLNNQVVTVYEKDDQGEYTRIVRQMICTSGRTELKAEDPEDEGTPTPAGIWKIGARERFGKFAAFGGEYARYWTQIVGGVYFHSVMYGKRDVNAFKSGAFGRLGSKGSHGCVRLYVEDAKWLYYYACPGTLINVTNGIKRNSALTRSLKTNLSFKEYNAFQKIMYDEAEQPNRSAWVTVEGAQLRTGNGSNDRAIMKLPVGAVLEVLQEGDPWAKVKYENREGYVKRGYITYEQGVMQSKEDADIVRATEYMYAEADTKSEKLVKVPTDTSVKVLETGEDYSKIDYDGTVGYLRNKALKKGWGAIRA